MTAAASKYVGMSPCASRKPAGKRSGARTAAALKPHAAAVPSAMSVNMFAVRCRSATHARAKTGQPVQNTTGADSASETQFAHAVGVWPKVTPGSIGAIASTNTGSVSAAATTVRRVMSRSSVSSSAPAVGVIGSSAMPHSGHVPGPS